MLLFVILTEPARNAPVNRLIGAKIVGAPNGNFATAVREPKVSSEATTSCLCLARGLSARGFMLPGLGVFNHEIKVLS